MVKVVSRPVWEEDEEAEALPEPLPLSAEAEEDEDEEDEEEQGWTEPVDEGGMITLPLLLLLPPTGAMVLVSGPLLDVAVLLLLLPSLAMPVDEESATAGQRVRPGPAPGTAVPHRAATLSA